MSKTQPRHRRAVRLAGAAAVLFALVTALTAPAAVGDGVVVIDFVSPDGPVSGVYTLNVSVTGDVEPGQVFYGLDASNVSEATTALTQTFGPFYEASFDTNPLAEGDHTIMVRVVDNTAANHSKTLDIEVDRTLPTATITSSAPEYVIGEYTVTAEVADKNLDPEGVDLILDGNLSNVVPMVKVGSDFEATFDSAVSLMDGPRTVAVKVVDTAGNEYMSETVTLQVDNYGPIVEFTSDGGHVMGIYELKINVTDEYLNTGSVYAVFDYDRVNKTALEYDGGGLYSYRFDTVPMDDGDHQVYIIAADLAGHSFDSDPLILQLDNNPPTVRITSEAGAFSGDYTVTATVRDPYLDEEVFLLIDGNWDYAVKMEREGDEWTTTIDTAELMDGNRTLNVWAKDMWGMEAMSPDLIIDVDNHAPYVRFLSSAGVKWGTYKISANVTDPHLNTSCVKVKVGSADPVLMRASNDEWYYNLDTRMLPSGDVTIMIMACDYRGNLNNNEMMTITVENRADLRITDVEWVNTEVEESGTFKVRVTVTNYGYTTVKDYNVALMTGGQTVDSTVETAGLAYNKDNTYTLEWKAEGKGDKIVVVRVDTDNVVEESDEGNNAWGQQTLTVKEASPGLGAAMVLLAFATVALVVLGRRHR